MATRTGTTSTTGTLTGGGATPIVGGHRGDGPGPEVMDASTLSGDSVVNSGGDDLGKIEAIMLDVTGGRIAYAVLSFGGFLGMGSKLFAIPWSALTLDEDEKCFILEMDKARLENAPGLDKDRWPDMADPTWRNQVYDYYGADRHW